MQILPQDPALSWLDLLGKLWQPFAVLLVLVGIAVEARIRKLVEKRATQFEAAAESKLLKAVLESAEQKLQQSMRGRVEEEANALRYELEKLMQKDLEQFRRDIQVPIGKIGLDSMQTEKRLVELETKTSVFWQMFTRDAAIILRQAEDDRK